MTGQLIGVNPAAIQEYAGSVSDNLGMVANELTEVVQGGFSLRYTGPDANEKFNPGLAKVMGNLVTGATETMVAYIAAINTVTSNIARSLGVHGGLEIDFQPKVPELPPLPGQTGATVQIDVDQFNTYINVTLPAHEKRLVDLINDNTRLIQVVRPAENDGWSGSARDHVQGTVVPQQVEALMQVVRESVVNVNNFMTEAVERATQADSVA